MLKSPLLRAKLLRVKQGAVCYLDRHLSGESMSFHQVIAIIVPLLVDQTFIVLLSLLNTAMISSSGDAAVAAVSMVDSLNIFILNVFIALATGGTVIVAQYKRKFRRLSKPRTGDICCRLDIRIDKSGGNHFFNPLLFLLFGRAEQAVFENAGYYLVGSSISYTLIAVIEAVSGVLRGIGNTKAVLWLSLIKTAPMSFQLRIPQHIENGYYGTGFIRVDIPPNRYGVLSYLYPADEQNHRISV